MLDHVAVYRVNKSFFFNNDPPPPHKGWTLSAFQEFCRLELEQAGFDLTRNLSVRYDPRDGKVVFWQEPVKENKYDAYFVLSEN